MTKPHVSASDRDEEIVKRWSDDPSLTFAALGADYGITGERTRQIVRARKAIDAGPEPKRNYLRVLGRIKEIDSLLQRGESIETIARAIKTDRVLVYRVLDDHRPGWRETLRQRKLTSSMPWIARTHSDDDLLGAIRSVAEDVGSPLSMNDYRRSSRGLPTVETIVNRFGTWRKACTKAGISCKRRNRGAGRSKMFSRDDCVQAVGSCWDEIGRMPSSEGYDNWWRRQPAGRFPSLSTVRVRVGWTRARRAASVLRKK